jgi:hypothetical protein
LFGEILLKANGNGLLPSRRVRRFDSDSEAGLDNIFINVTLRNVITRSVWSTSEIFGLDPS